MDYKKPKIAILLAAPDNNFIRVDKRNSEAVIRAGGIPLHITPDRIDEQLEELRPAGLLLPGGNFPIPDEYYTDKSAYQDEQPERVAAYFTMVEWSKKNNVCLLGICAGMQILAAALGGKLSSGISGHRREDDYRHLVHVAQGSLLSKIINRDSFETNTKHNEAVVEAAGGDFLVSARADDCVVEAVEPKKPWSDFVLGVQWHPEELASSAKNEQEIFNAFVKAAGRG